MKCLLTILISYFPASRHDCFHVKTARFVRWHHSLPTFGSEIALSTRMSAGVAHLLVLLDALALWPRKCLFPLKENCCSHCNPLSQNLDGCAQNIRVRRPHQCWFSTWQIHLLTAFNNDWFSNKYSIGSSISVSRSASKNAANSCWIDLEPFHSRPTLHWCFFFFHLKLLYAAPILPLLSEPSSAITLPWNP